MFGNINRALGSTTPQQRAQMLAIAGGSSPSPTMGNALYGQSQAIMQALQDEQRLKAQAEQAEQDRRMRMSEGAADRDQRMSELDANIKWKTADSKQQADALAEYNRQRIEQDIAQTGYSRAAAEATLAMRQTQEAAAKAEIEKAARENAAIQQILKDPKNPLYNQALAWSAGFKLNSSSIDPYATGGDPAVDPSVDIINAGNGVDAPKAAPAQAPAPAQIAPAPAQAGRAAPTIDPRLIVTAPRGTPEEYQARIRAQAAAKMDADLRELKRKVNRGLIAPALQGMQQPYYGPTGVAPDEWGD